MVELIESIVNVQDWLLALQEGIDVYRDPLITLATRLAFLGIVIGGIQVVVGRSSDFVGVLTRVLGAALLLSLSPAINTLALATWTDLGEFASQRLAADYQSANEELLRINTSSQTLMQDSNILLSDPNAQVAGDGVEVVGSTSILNMNSMVVQYAALTSIAMSLVVLFMFLILVLTGMAITVGGILLPLTAGLIAVPGGWGGSMASAYVRVVTSSLLLVMIFPVAFQVIFQFTAVQPLTYMADELDENLEQYEGILAGLGGGANTLNRVTAIEDALAKNESDIADIRNDPANRVDGPWFWDGRALTEAAKAAISRHEATIRTLKAERKQLQGNWLTSAVSQLRADVMNFGRNLRVLFMSLGILLLGLIGAVFAVMRLEGYIGALVGSFVVGAAASMAALVIGSAALAGKMGGMSLPKGKGTPEPKPAGPGIAWPDEIWEPYEAPFNTYVNVYDTPRLQGGREALPPAPSDSLGSGSKQLPPRT